MAKLPDDLHRKLAKVGILVPRAGDEEAAAVPTLETFIDAYIEKRKADTNPGTRVNYKQAKTYLVKFFGEMRPLNKITEGEAEDFKLDLLTKLSENTAKRLCGRAKQFFAKAVKDRHISANPFRDMTCALVENRERDYFITRDEAAAVLDACPDAQWRLLFALSRYGGLVPIRASWLAMGRCGLGALPHDRAKPQDGTQGQAKSRRPNLPRVAAAPGGSLSSSGRWSRVCHHPLSGPKFKPSDATGEDHRTGRAEGMAEAFQNLRATRATELVSAGWPKYKVCEWLGHTEAVAKTLLASHRRRLPAVRPAFP